MKETELYLAAKAFIASIDEFRENYPDSIETLEDFYDTHAESSYYASIEQIRAVLNQIDQENG